MNYIENPKTKGSGVICCIPQKEVCPNNCPDCFFQSGRSYLEPLEKNLPNMPNVSQRIVRVNDGNDSNVDRQLVISSTRNYPHKFYNTSKDLSLDEFPGPVVLTVNPREMIDESFLHALSDNLMFVRALTNTWNLKLVDKIVDYYTSPKIPVILTFMAYHNKESIPGKYHDDYTYRRRTLNSYWAITEFSWNLIMLRYYSNHLVYSCGTEGETGTTLCKHCGNCLREYYAFYERR